MSLSFHQDPPGDDHIIYRFTSVRLATIISSFIVSPASDWRRSFHIIYRFTSVRLATIISYHLSFHQRQTGDDHFISFIVSPASDWRRLYHITSPSESTFSASD
ncbi:hypothetical protein P8452_55886 [Trifolium repens]|nr:hypothetical protein P8452_55886 [Trifolium repens]